MSVFYMNQNTLTYNIELPKEVDQILNVDFWVYTSVNSQLLRPVTEAVKFTSAVSVYVRNGSAEVEINLLNVKINSPCIVTIKPSDVIRLRYVSNDFDASFVVMSPKVHDSLLLSLHDAGVSPVTHLNPATHIPSDCVEAFNRFYEYLERINSDDKNIHRLQAFYHATLAFYFNIAYMCYSSEQSRQLMQPSTYQHNPLVDRFLVLVQQKFKEQRQIDFYANQLGITSKHLSRILKQSTGFTAADWIKNYLLLEAKVMLKSSTLNMSQISTLLNFPSQSFFAKFFKKATGMTPKQYRNFGV